MFQQPDSQETRKNARLVMVLVAAAVALAAGLFVAFSDFASPAADAPKETQGLPDARRAGDPIFDDNKSKIQLVNKKFYTQGNLLGQVQAVMKGEILNLTNKEILGVELRATVLMKDGKTKSIVACPIPRVFEKVPAQTKVAYDVVVDGVPKPDQIDDMTIELEGLILSE